MSSFGDQERDPTEQVHHGSFNFRSLLGVCASTPRISILGEFGRFPLLVRRVKAVSLYYNRLIGLRGTVAVRYVVLLLRIACVCGRSGKSCMILRPCQGHSLCLELEVGTVMSYICWG
jgi:hypothetical protein